MAEPGPLMPPFVHPEGTSAYERAVVKYYSDPQCPTFCLNQGGGLNKGHKYVTHLGERVCVYCGCKPDFVGGRRRRTQRRRTNKRRASRRNRRTARR